MQLINHFEKTQNQERLRPKPLTPEQELELTASTPAHSLDQLETKLDAMFALKEKVDNEGESCHLLAI